MKADKLPDPRYKPGDKVHLSGPGVLQTTIFQIAKAPTFEDGSWFYVLWGFPQVRYRERVLFPVQESKQAPKVMTEQTPRGFAYVEFQYRDYRGEPERRFSIQESSLATEHKVWVGADDQRAHLGIKEARIVRDALSEWLAQFEEETP